MPVLGYVLVCDLWVIKNPRLSCRGFFLGDVTQIGDEAIHDIKNCPPHIYEEIRMAVKKSHGSVKDKIRQ